MTDLPTFTYLYGFTKNEIKSLETTPYKQAILAKIIAAKGLNERLLAGTYMDADTNRVNAVHKAIKFNQQLLSELL